MDGRRKSKNMGKDEKRGWEMLWSRGGGWGGGVTGTGSKLSWGTDDQAGATRRRTLK